MRQLLLLGVVMLIAACQGQQQQSKTRSDADKLLAVATSLSTKSTSTLSSLLQSYSGLKLGWAMSK